MWTMRKIFFSDLSLKLFKNKFRMGSSIDSPPFMNAFLQIESFFTVLQVVREMRLWQRRSSEVPHDAVGLWCILMTLFFFFLEAILSVSHVPQAPKAVTGPYQGHLHQNYRFAFGRVRRIWSEANLVNATTTHPRSLLIIRGDIWNSPSFPTVDCHYASCPQATTILTKL